MKHFRDDEKIYMNFRCFLLPSVASETYLLKTRNEVARCDTNPTIDSPNKAGSGAFIWQTSKTTDSNLPFAPKTNRPCKLPQTEFVQLPQ